MYEQLTKHSLLMTLTEDSKKKLSKLARQIRYKSGDFLLKENEPNDYLFLLLDGVIRIESNTGELIAILQPGAVIGEISTAGLSLPIANAIAVNDVKTLAFPIHVITELSNKEPSFAEALQNLGMERVMARMLDS
jgi:CRP-like cAMP-binding protein